MMSYQQGLDKPVHTETVYINLPEEVSVNSIIRVLERGNAVLTDSKFMRLNDSEVTRGKSDIKKKIAMDDIKW